MDCISLFANIGVGNAYYRLGNISRFVEHGKEGAAEGPVEASHAFMHSMTAHTDNLCIDNLAGD